ncbi:MAG: hypothetical protein KAT37_01285 [Candidatus Aenigmarchaeota archaeon]|nr:hypothetical protein [Candidatus Aenigmarchaeota archaeon]
MKHSLKIGLFIGVTIASISSLILQFVPINYWTIVAVLYLYSIVGALTSYFVHINLKKRIKIKIEKKLDGFAAE